MDNLPGVSPALPSGWVADSGAGKTIKVWFGDQIKNGVTPNTLTIERGFLDQVIPTYIVNTGMQIGTFTQEITSGDKIKGVATFTGLGGSEGTVTLDASPDPVTTGLIMAANANVGRLGVNGSQLTGPNWAKAISFQIENNLRVLESVDSQSPVFINDGECKVTGKMTMFFGSDAELAAYYQGIARPINARVAKNGQALIYQVPRATYRGGGNPSATAKNTDVMIDVDFQASADVLTNAHVLLDRVEYFEA
jgi:tail tube protein